MQVSRYTPVTDGVSRSPLTSPVEAGRLAEAGGFVLRAGVS